MLCSTFTLYTVLLRLLHHLIRSGLGSRASEAVAVPLVAVADLPPLASSWACCLNSAREGIDLRSSLDTSLEWMVGSGPADVPWNNCPQGERHLYYSRYGYPSIAYSVVVNHSRRFSQSLQGTKLLARWSKRIESVRKDVECTFGILKRRFRILKVPMPYTSKEQVENIMFTCCVLHNILLGHLGDCPQPFNCALHVCQGTPSTAMDKA